MRTRVLVAVAQDGTVIGGVRLHHESPGAADLGWWRGSRLVAAGGAGALVRRLDQLGPLERTDRPCTAGDRPA